jgi:hypothetical protein
MSKAMAHSTDQTPQHSSAPEDFAPAAELIRSLIANRGTRSDRLEQDDIRDAMQTVANFLRNRFSPSLRLEAASLLGKANETFKSKLLTERIANLVGQGLTEPLPSIGDWGNADDRRYLAKAVILSNAPWIPQYAAEALAQTEISEKVSRDIWAELAISRASDLASSLRAVARASTEWLSQRSDSAELAYRKLRRICDALGQTLLTADVPAGPEFGEALTALVRLAGGGKGSEALKVREEAAIGVLDLIIQILKFRFDLLFDSDIYRAVGTVRGWWRPARPPDDVEHRSDRIAHFAMQGLHVLARQGVQDRELRLALTKSLGAARINSSGEAIAAKDISLNPESAKFLATGQELLVSRTNEALQDLNEQDFDDLLARLLLTTKNQDTSADTIRSIADAIDLFEPGQASIIRKAGSRLELMDQWVDALTGKRKLSTYAVRGELVEYDPAFHDTPEALQRLSQVRVVVPGVVRKIEGRPATIIVKAIVEKR